MTDRESLLAAILNAEPPNSPMMQAMAREHAALSALLPGLPDRLPVDCWTAMLVFADYLEERGDPLAEGYRRMSAEHWWFTRSVGAMIESGKWMASGGRRYINIPFDSKREAMEWVAEYLSKQPAA